MKWMIASDLHGSAYYCRKMLEAFEREGADRLFLLGDLLYHGPRNDLPREYAPNSLAFVHTSCTARKEKSTYIRPYETTCHPNGLSWSQVWFPIR